MCGSTGATPAVKVFNSLDEVKVGESQRKQLLYLVTLAQRSCGYSEKVDWKNVHTPQQSNKEDCGSFATYCILTQLKQNSDFQDMDQYSSFVESDVHQFRMGLLQFIYYLSGDERYSAQAHNCLICLLPVDLSRSVIGYCESSRQTGLYHDECLSVCKQCLCCNSKTQFIVSSSSSYFNLLEQWALNGSAFYRSVWYKTVVRTSLHLCKASIKPHLIGPILSEFMLVFTALRKLRKEEGMKLISNPDMLNISAHFKRILSLTAYRDHSRCKFVNSCASFLDMKMIAILKSLASFGKRLVGSIKGETLTFLDCLLSWAELGNNSACYHEFHGRDLKPEPVTVEYLPDIRANDVKTVCDDVLVAVRTTSGSYKGSKRWREEDECNFLHKKHKFF